MAEIAYTEEELRQRNIGKSIYQKEDYGWNVKLNTYRELGVHTQLTKVRNSLRVILTDWKAYCDDELVNKISVIMMDTYLIKKSRGLDWPMPQPLVPANAIVNNSGGAGEVKGLMSTEDFGEVANIESPDLIKGLMWIYNNLSIENPDPTKAPSMGDYSHLKYLQQNPEAKKDFLKSVYPRLIPPKSQLDGADKFNDDNRAIFDILERLQKECAVSTS